MWSNINHVIASFKIVLMMQRLHLVLGSEWSSRLVLNKNILRWHEISQKFMNKGNRLLHVSMRCKISRSLWCAAVLIFCVIRFCQDMMSNVQFSFFQQVTSQLRCFQELWITSQKKSSTLYPFYSFFVQFLTVFAILQKVLKYILKPILRRPEIISQTVVFFIFSKF